MAGENFLKNKCKNAGVKMESIELRRDCISGNDHLITSAEMQLLLSLVEI